MDKDKFMFRSILIVSMVAVLSCVFLIPPPKPYLIIKLDNGDNSEILKVAVKYQNLTPRPITIQHEEGHVYDVFVNCTSNDYTNNIIEYYNNCTISIFRK